MKELKGLVVLIVAILMVGCYPDTEEPLTEVTLDVFDPTYRKIKDYQDQRLVDSILMYTSDPNPAYRYLVANSMASIQSEKALDSLYQLLMDPILEIRTAAAFSIGQIGKESSTDVLLNAFRAKDSIDVDNHYNATILEAVGKLGPKKLLTPLATVSTYRMTDTLLLLGQTRAIYQYALRGHTTLEGTDRMIYYLTEGKTPESVRVLAAYYLARARDIDLTASKFRIAEIFTSSQNPNVKMMLAIALGKTKDREILNILRQQYEVEESKAVKLNILRAYSNFNYIAVIDDILKEVTSEDKEIASTAAHFLITNGNRNDALIYKDFITDNSSPEVIAKIYSSILKFLPTYFINSRNGLKNELKEKIEQVADPYDKAHYYSAFGYDPASYKEIIELTSDSKHAIIRTTGAEALYSLMKIDGFVQTFRGGHKRIKREIIDLIQEQLEKPDAGTAAIYAELLSDPDLDLKSLSDDFEFIKNAASKLDLPKEIETYNSLMKAYSFLTDKAFTVKTPDYNHPIDWTIFSSLGDTVQVVLKTSKGNIRAMMYSYDAQGSVANFMQLAQDNYYDGLNFHRVVPNFVIQGGCPRGDGFGSLDYTIRSEFNQVYYDGEGYLGMASAGKDTEGTQFFITLAPTPHLNGKYTIFGKVISGMDIVNKIEVGDKIEDVVITKL